MSIKYTKINHIGLVGDDYGNDVPYIIEPQKFGDNRGYFQEVFSFVDFGFNTQIKFNVKQLNESKSSKFVVRGLHMQKYPFEQAKIVRCTNGSIIDVFMDVRDNSKSYGTLYTVLLSADNNKQVYIPKGFVHGFISLEDDTVINYLVNENYDKKSEDGYLFNEKLVKKILDLYDKYHFLTIDKFVFSEKDKQLSEFDKPIKIVKID